MTQKFSQPIVLNTQGNPGVLTFSVTEDLIEWVDIELQRWRECQQNVKENSMRFVLSSQINDINDISVFARNQLNTDESIIDPDTLKSFLENYALRNIIHSESAAGRYAIELIRDTNQYIVTQGLGFMQAALKVPHTQHIQPRFLPDFVSGIARYEMFQGFDAQRYAGAFDEMITDRFPAWEKTMADLSASMVSMASQAEDSVGTMAADHQDWVEKTDQRQVSYEADLAAVKKRYQEEMRVRAPADYWKSKAKFRTGIGCFLSIVFATVIAITIGYVTKNIELPDDPENIAQALRPLLAYLLPGFFLVWGLRVILKLALSNLAIADDARHRVTLVNTYRSLMEDEGHVEDADRILMLQALFRPTPGSGGDEDTAPPNWFDVLMQRMDSKSK